MISVSYSASGSFLYGASLSFKLYETFYCDYIYQSSGTKYTTHGGSYNVGFISGAFSIGLGGASNYSGVQIGASISFKIYETFYCDYFAQSNTRNYPARGGRSGHGNYCGTFYVSIRNPFGGSEWNISASLSFKLDSCIKKNVGLS